MIAYYLLVLSVTQMIVTDITHFSNRKVSFSGKALSGPLLHRREQEQTSSLACPLHEGGRAGSSYEVRVGVCPGVGSEGWLRCLAHPLGGVECRGVCSILFLLLTYCFCFRLLKMADFLVSLLSFVQNLPQLFMHTAILSPIQFLCILLLKERYVQVQALKHCKRSQIPACLIPPWETIHPCS